MLRNFFLVRWVKTLIQLYIDAFRYRLSRRLFVIIAIKMIIIFAILKVLFFHNYLDEHFKTDKEKAQYVLNNLTSYAPVVDSSKTFRYNTNKTINNKNLKK